MISVDKAVKVIEYYKNRGISSIDYGDLFSTILVEGKATPMELIEAINSLNSFLYTRVNQLYISAKVSKENSVYLEKYLSGNLYKDQKEPDDYDDVQLLNAHRIHEEANFALHED